MSLKRYFVLLISVFLGLSALNQVYVQVVRLGCWSGGYAKDGWLAYCNSTLYGVFDPDAIWFELEAEVVPAITKAKVLTLSDSHLQNALSLGGASEWFAAHHVPAYFLGLPVQESGFGEHLIEKFKPEASVVIFAASPYFTGKNGLFLSGAMSKPEQTREKALDLIAFQNFHQRFCTRLSWACDYNFAYFRSRSDGHWIFPPQTQKLFVAEPSLPTDAVHFPAAERPNELQPLYPEYLEAARRITGKLSIPRECIVITNVPTEHEGDELAHYLASSLGVSLIDPGLTDLTTFDRSHLTPDSSARWTKAFLNGLEPILQHCLASAENDDSANGKPVALQD